MTGHRLPVRSVRPRRPPRSLRKQPSALTADDVAVTARQAFTEALLETIDVGIVSCDADGVFVVSNRAERAMFGFDDGIGGLELADLEPRIDVFDADGNWLPASDYPLTRALRGEDVTAMNVVAGPAGGPYREIVVRGRQIRASDGALLGAVAALTDVTAERQASRALAEEHRRLVEAQRLGKLGSFEHDFATGRWAFSDNLCRLWGFEPGEFTAELLYAHILDEDRPIAQASWNATRQEPGAHSCEYRIRRADGEERLIRSDFEAEFGADGEPTHGRGTHLDITDLTAAENAAKQASLFFDAVLTATPDYIFVTDVRSGAIIYGSRGKDVVGRCGAELDALGHEGMVGLAHPDDANLVRSLGSAVGELSDGAVLQIEYRAMHTDGSWRWLSHRVTPFRRDSAGGVIESLAVVRDVTDVVDAEQRLVHAAQHDYLTGLPNRGLLVRRLDAALERSRRDGCEIAVLFCDLDGFKIVNDTGGHAAGDAVLVETARRLSAIMRQGDTVARVGGDEFVIVVEPWSRGGSVAPAARPPGESVARRVTQALRRPIAIAGVNYVVTASIGITYATLVGDGADVTADAVLHNADAAMYNAKAQGKNRFEVFSRDPAERVYG